MIAESGLAVIAADDLADAAQKAVKAAEDKMKIKEIAFVGIPVTDLKRARGFYEGVLGLKVSDEMMGGSGSNIRLATTRSLSPVSGQQWMPSDQGTSAALEVENLTKRWSVERAKVRFRPNHLKVPVAGWRSSRTRTATRLSFTN